MHSDDHEKFLAHRKIPKSPWKHFPKLIPGLKQHREAQLLEKSDEYWQEIANFRQEFAKDLISAPPFRDKEQTKLLESILLQSEPCNKEPANTDGSVHSGFYSIDERLFPRKEKNPFLFVFDDPPDLAAPTPPNGLHTEEPPVKVSIPSTIELPQRQSIHKPHRRKSFDPQDSNQLHAYLHNAYIPLGPRNIYPKQKPTNLSLKSESLRQP